MERFGQYLKKSKKWISHCIIKKWFDTECGKLFEIRKKLKLDLNVNNDQETKNKLNQIEHDIANKIDEQFRIKVQSTLGHITGDDGAINTNGM